MKETWPAAAEVLAMGGSASDAARAASVTSRTIRRWRADEVIFADAIEDGRAQMLTATAGLLAATTTAAAHKLEQIIETGEERHALAASRVVLDQAAKYRSDRAIEDRIEALEAAVNLRSWQ